MSCHNCYGSQAGPGSINTNQLPSNTGNAPQINTFGQRSEQRPNEYWTGSLLHARIPEVARRPSGIWPKPDRNCPCDIAVRTYQNVFQKDHVEVLALLATSSIAEFVKCVVSTLITHGVRFRLQIYQKSTHATRHCWPVRRLLHSDARYKEIFFILMGAHGA